MKIKMPKIAYGHLKTKRCTGKLKWHLASNVHTKKTVCGQSYGCKLEKVFDTQSITKLRSEQLCLRCFAAFVIE